MKVLACCIMGLSLLFAGTACERTDKAIETYKKVKEDAKERAEEAKQGAQNTMEKKAKALLGTERNLDAQVDGQDKQDK